MITIGFLADHLDTIPTLIQWFRGQWPEYYKDWSQKEMEQDFLEDISRNSLPSRLVVFEAGELAGTIILRKRGDESATEFEPELGGLYVAEAYRGHGIGTELVRAGMKLAAEQGFKKVYATTVRAAGILERLGWEFVQTLEHDGESLKLYQCELIK